MSAELHVCSEVPPLEWPVFTKTYPSGSIALDGYVSGPPRFEAAGPHQNFNHHEGVDRLATLSTAQQVLTAIRMGMDKRFQRGGLFGADVFVNDCDEDVCAAWFLLDHIEQTKAVTNPALNRFVEVAGKLDVTAGAYPYDKDLRLLGQLDWVFEPYHLFRASGEMSQNNNMHYRSVIQDVGHRIQKHLLGEGGSIPADTRYERLSSNTGWSMLRPIGRNAAIGAFDDGIDAFVTVQQTDETTWRYGLRRRSHYIPFDLPALYEVLNKHENNASDRWGGADNAGGSPRVAGSKLSPDMVQDIIERHLATEQH